jgi:hypothetical protein
MEKDELTYTLDSAQLASISEKNNSFYPLNNIENNYKDVFAVNLLFPCPFTPHKSLVGKRY